MRKKQNKYEDLAKPKKQLDFHDLGILNEDEILSIGEKFLDECIFEKINKALIITGKGLHSKGKTSIIKPIIISLLKRKKEIKTFYSSPINRGGEGAIEIIFL